tara:strand:- start:517 stop:696 length:180 start_codon:yes stop_codon:yes gene_type:complete
MNPSPRERDKDTEKAMDEFLAKGGKIEQVPYGKRSETTEVTGGFYGRKKKPKQEEPNKD